MIIDSPVGPIRVQLRPHSAELKEIVDDTGQPLPGSGYSNFKNSFLSSDPKVRILLWVEYSPVLLAT
jgi:hypothetical protein